MSWTCLCSRSYEDVHLPGTTTEDVGAWNNSLAAAEPFGWTRFVEGSSMGVEFHVLWVDTRTEDP